jgi:hypothetical protein
MAVQFTYVPIATTTLGSAANSVTFSSIPSTYQDLVLVINYGQTSGANGFGVQFNGDSGTNYSNTYLIGNGSTATSSRATNGSEVDIGSGIGGSNAGGAITRVNFMNYANTATYKTILCRSDNASVGTQAIVGLWRSTSAITSMVISLAGSFSSTPTALAGSIFTLYGLAAA